MSIMSVFAASITDLTLAYRPLATPPDLPTELVVPISNAVNLPRYSFCPWQAISSSPQHPQRQHRRDQVPSVVDRSPQVSRAALAQEIRFSAPDCGCLRGLKKSD